MKKDMTAGTDWRHILLFTLPIMAGNLLQQLYNTTDGIIVGRFVSSYALAAVGTCAPLTILFLAFALGIGAGGGIIVSQYFGAGKMDEMRLAVSTVLIFMCCVGLIMSILGITLSPLILRYILNVPAKNGIAGMSVLYFQIFSIGLFFQFVYNAIAFMLRAVGNSRATLYFLLISTASNVVLDLLFVAVFHWGVGGSAVATVISQAGCAVISYLYMIKKVPDLKPDWGGRVFDKQFCQTTVRLSLPVGFQQCVVSVGHIAMQRLVNSFGDASMSAYTAANMIEQFALIPVMSFNVGIATFAGQNVGAKQIERTKKGMKKTQLMSMTCVLAIILVIYTLTPQLLGLFKLEGTSLARGLEQLRYTAPWYMLFSVYLVVGGMLQGSGDVLTPMVATVSALIMRILIGYIGSHTGLLTHNAAWVGTPFAWILATGINITGYLRGAWTRKAITKDTAEIQAE